MNIGYIAVIVTVMMGLSGVIQLVLEHTGLRKAARIWGWVLFTLLMTFSGLISYILLTL